MPLAAVEKVLSRNDLGLTGSHQAGILVPKNPQILGFFPALDPDEFNPSIRIHCFMPQLERTGEFRFVYYNNRRHGEGTRDEYRLTRMTAVLRSLRAEVGDTLILRWDTGDVLKVTLSSMVPNKPTEKSLRNEYLLAGGWRIVSR